MANLDISTLCCAIGSDGTYTATHPDAPGISGRGDSSDAACAALAETAGVQLVVRLRRESVSDGTPGAVLSEGVGATPDEAWAACNAAKADGLVVQAAAVSSLDAVVAKASALVAERR